MQRTLTIHSAPGDTQIQSISVETEWRTGSELWLRYHVDGPLEKLQLSDPACSARVDELWKTTCFELFLRGLGRAGYCEFNFSPSSRWAAYRFTAKREGCEELGLPASPEIGLDASENHFALEAILSAPSELAAVDLSAGLSAVIEETDGTKSYWALAHPPGKPDFHHPDCFTLELPPPNAP